MPYAVTLPLDAAAAAQVKRMWCALAEQAGADDAVRLGYVPHVTLAVLPGEVPVLALEKAMVRAVEGWSALTVVIAGLGIFPGTPQVIWAVPVVTATLLASHTALCTGLEPFSIHPHYRSGHWIPHVTLSQEAPSPARAIEIITSLWDGPINARLERVELVRFPPVEVLQSHLLASAE